MPTKERDHRRGEPERAVAQDADLALGEDATLEQIEATLGKLRQVLKRVARRELEPEDWAVLSSVIREAM